MDADVREVVTLFEHRFGRPPRWIAAAPGRVNLIGEHTDYTGGFVLPIAIERRTAIAAAPARNPKRSTLVAHDLGREVEIDLTQPLRPLPRTDENFFANYILGVVEQFRSGPCGDSQSSIDNCQSTIGLAIPNLDLMVKSTVPLAAGLSSSASVEVAMATLLEEVTGGRMSPLDKVLLCQRAEHEFPGTPCGIMDMYAATMARKDHALLIDCRSNESVLVPMPPAEEMTLLVFDTGVKHDLAAGEYAERRRSCEEAATALGIPSLRDATVSMIEDGRARGAIDEIQSRRAMHVVLENVRTLIAARALSEGRLDVFCAQMLESHKSLRNLYSVSCPELDAIVDTAADLAARTGDALLGARMTGGGFGGCAIVFCRTAAADAVETVIASRFADAFGRAPAVFRTGAAGGAEIIATSRHPERSDG